MATTGRLIVIEGADGSGKKTQVDLALDTWPDNRRVTYFDFPRYGRNPAGTLIREALDGKHGNFRKLDAKLAAMPYVLDRLLTRAELNEALEKGDVLCNRYVTSNLMYGAAKYTSRAKQDEYIAWDETLEYGWLDLPKPDLVLYLDVPYEISKRLVRRRGKADQHEKDGAYQRRVMGLYARMTQRRSSWVRIPCVKVGKLLSKEEIHKKVMHYI